MPALGAASNLPGSAGCLWDFHRIFRDCHQVLSGPLMRSRRVRLLVESGPTFTPPDSPRFDKLTEIGPTLNRFRNPHLIGV